MPFGLIGYQIVGGSSRRPTSSPPHRAATAENLPPSLNGHRMGGSCTGMAEGGLAMLFPRWGCLDLRVSLAWAMALRHGVSFCSSARQRRRQGRGRRSRRKLGGPHQHLWEIQKDRRGHFDDKILSLKLDNVTSRSKSGMQRMPRRAHQRHPDSYKISGSAWCAKISS